MTKTTQWKPTGAGNLILDGDGFFISYNGDTLNSANPDLQFFNYLGAVIGLKTAPAETALVILPSEGSREKAFLILNGDFRKEYEEAFSQGLQACIGVYEKHKASHDSDWSTGNKTMLAAKAKLATMTTAADKETVA